VTGGFALAELTGPDESPFSEPAAPTTAVAWAGKITAAERVAVVPALRSRDAGTRRRAEQTGGGTLVPPRQIDSTTAEPGPTSVALGEELQHCASLRLLIAGRVEPALAQ
jgi:hypothetical protein